MEFVYPVLFVDQYYLHSSGKMKKFTRMVQGYEKGRPIVDPEFDDAYEKFKKLIADTDSLCSHLGNFSRVCLEHKMYTNFFGELVVDSTTVVVLTIANVYLFVGFLRFLQNVGSMKNNMGAVVKTVAGAFPSGMFFVSVLDRLSVTLFTLI